MFSLRNFSISNLMLLLTGLFILAAPARAALTQENSALENLEQRIEKLETRQTATAAAEQGAEEAFARIGRHLTLHGLLEAEAFYAKTEGDGEESDLTLATAELSLVATLNDHLGGHLTLLYEEEEGEDDTIDVDEAVIRLTSAGQLFGQTMSLHVGRMYVPFGMFNSGMISDPLTLELGETRDSAALLVLAGDVWTFKAGLFNGGVDTAGDHNQIDSWVASLEVTPLENLAFGFSLISDLAESDNELVQDPSLYTSSVAGASAFLSARYGAFALQAEYLAAVANFASSLVAIGEDLSGRRPAAWHLELSWLPTDRLELAARYEQAKDFQDDLRRYGATAAYHWHDHVATALEYLHADGDANAPVHTVTAQLSLQF